MFTTMHQSGNIYRLESAFSWGPDRAAIVDIVTRYFSDFNENGFYPHPSELALREELLAVPTLRGLSRGLRMLRARAAVLGNLGLKDLPERERNTVLYALTLALGFPTSTDQRTHRVAWDVKARPENADFKRFVTFSERVGSADMHTDSSFYPMPEEQFILYVVRAARCQGGLSLVVDSDDICRVLQESAAGRQAYALLCTSRVPFRAPSVYAANDTDVEIFLARVIEPVGTVGDEPTVGVRIRWRYDAIQKGLASRPEFATPELVAALELFNDIVEVSAPRFQEQLPDDTLLWVDNHRSLHGRTTYDDTARHLIRIRISSVPNAERIGPSGIVRD